jgi:hypothetical protein
VFKKITVTALLLAFVFLAAAPDTLADCRRNRRSGFRTAYYNPYRYQAGYNSPYRYRSVAGQRYYANNAYGYNGYGYNGYRNNGYRYNGYGYNGYRSRSHSTRNLILSVAAPGAIGAGVGALFGGKKGAGIGALLGGGGGAAYYLLRHRNRRY